MQNPISSIMEVDAYTCYESATLEDVVKTLVERQIGGLVIINDKEHVVGFISDGDIMKAVAKQRTRAIYSGDSSMVFYDDESLENKLRNFKMRNVMELATRNVICATPDRSIEEVARMLSKKKIKKIPIVNENGMLVGIARRSTILRYIFSLILEMDSL
ncbi:MAG: CBS domain-containing protein [Anaerovorax sp.]